MFTQRHYIAIAAEMRRFDRWNIELAHEANSGRVEAEFSRGCDTMLTYVRDALIQAFERDNPKFDRDKFIAAMKGN